MNLDWSIVWQSRWRCSEGALVTILLTALTMVIAVPGGILLALMRSSRFEPIACSRRASSSCSATCR